LELRGIPTITLVATRFTVLANYERKSLGMPDLPVGVVPYPMTGAPIEEAQRRARAIRNDLVRALTEGPGDSQIEVDQVRAAMQSESMLVQDLPDRSLEGINRAFFDRKWGDGLPIVPPTAERVLAMLRFTDRDPSTSLGNMGPLWAPATVHHLAVNAVMAGCRPEYFPVVLAGIEAILDPRFNLYGVQGTTNPAGVMLMVNGPIARELEINGGANLFGQGWYANGTIGRAIRLSMINIGGGRPGEGDMSTLGNPNKWGSCIAEFEEKSPWPAYHVEKGFAASTSTVTAVACAAPQNVVEMSAAPEAILNTMARALTSAGSNTTIFDQQPMVIFSPVQARRLADGGFDKPAIRRWLWERGRFELDLYDATSQRVIREWKQRCLRNEDGKAYVYPSASAEDIGIAVGGSDSGPHSAVLATFNGTHLITRAITRLDGTPVGSVRDLCRGD
jgi:hypothetical protein